MYNIQLTATVGFPTKTFGHDRLVQRAQPYQNAPHFCILSPRDKSFRNYVYLFVKLLLWDNSLGFYVGIKLLYWYKNTY